MATPFTKIYKKYLSLIKDFDTSNSYANMRISDLYDCLFDLLSYAIGDFEEYCFKDLNTTIDFNEQVYTLVGDGTTETFSLVPDLDLSKELYVEVSGTEITNYTNTINTLTITPAVGDQLPIYVSNYEIGEFTNADLNNRETNILALLMVTVFIQREINSTELLNQKVYGKDWQIHSQGNHIKALTEALLNAQKKIEKDIRNYTINQDPNDLKRYGGGSSLGY